MSEQQPSRRSRAGLPTGGPRDHSLVGWVLVLGLLALVAEILLFAALAQLTRHYAGGGVLGIVVATVVTIGAAVLWGIFLAPKAPRRLPMVARVAVIGLVGVALGFGLRATGWPRWGLLVIACGVLLMVLQWLAGLREERAEKARTDCFPGVPPEDRSS